MEPLYTVYRTTNTVTGKFYIGVHKTFDPNDSYLGSGIALKDAVKTHGRAAFRKEILFAFATSAEAYDKERELVTRELVEGGSTYNLTEGGVPSIDWGNRRKATALRGEDHPQWGKSDPEMNRRRSESMKLAHQKLPAEHWNREKGAAKRRGVTTSLKGVPQSEELKAKRAEAMRNIPKIECPHCQKPISPSNLKNHLRVHSA
jgi:hypothetical protein